MRSSLAHDSLLVLTATCEGVTGPISKSAAGSKDSYDFGEGAGFYVNATQPGWEKWRMYEYITVELPQVLLQFTQLNVEKVKETK